MVWLQAEATQNLGLSPNCQEFDFQVGMQKVTQAGDRVTQADHAPHAPCHTSLRSQPHDLGFPTDSEDSGVGVM